MTVYPIHQSSRCILSGASAILVLLATLPALSAQAIDPTRLGEGVRPLSTPNVIAEEGEGSGNLGLEDQNDFAPYSSGDDDIGQQLILKNSERERWINLQANASLFWTDNAANLSSGGDEDFFWAGQFGLGIQPRLRDRLYLDAFISQQIYRYDQYDFLDYEYLQASVGVIYLEPRLWDSVLYLQGQFSRTTADDFGQEVLNSASIIGGIQKTVLFDRRNSLYMNLMGDWDVYADVDQLSHSEYIADLSYQFKIMRDLVLSASYRFTWFDYNRVDRADALNIMGVYLTWTPEKWISIYAGGTFNFNESDVDAFDYQSTSLGGGLGVQIRF